MAYRAIFMISGLWRFFARVPNSHLMEGAAMTGKLTNRGPGADIDGAATDDIPINLD